MKKLLFITTCVFFILTCDIVFAHQPRLVDSDFIFIENPEVSQAFYGELKGRPDFYQIQSEVPIKLYIGVLVPDVDNIGKDVSVGVSKNNEFYYLLDGVNFEWQAYYEEFAGDDYFKGPEFSDGEYNNLPKGVEVGAGMYAIEVFSPDNLGKYVLVVGEKEEFPISEMLNTLISLPRLKIFFDKSPLQALTAPIILRFIIIPFVLLMILIITIFFSIRRRKRKK